MANEAQSSGGFSGGGGGAGTVTTVSIVTSQGVSGVVANATTTPAITLTLGALTGIASFNGLVVTANTGTITTGTWNGTAIAANYGGTDQTVYAVGDLLYASTTTALSKLADVAVGSYLRSGGVNTAPLWSTLKLPNSATANYIPYATSTNTWGESSNLDYASNCLRSLKVGTASTDVSARFGYVGFQSFTADNTILGFNFTYNGGRYATGYSSYIQQYQNQGLGFYTSSASAGAGSSASFVNTMSLTYAGIRVMNGNTVATAYLQIGAGTATASTAPLKFTSGTNLTTAEAGAMEYNGTNLFFTRAGTVRENILVAIDNVAAPSTTATPTFTAYYGGNTNALGDPNRWLSVNVLGSTYKIPLYT